jgi:hypothetical protein
MEIGKGEAFTGVQAHLVRCGEQHAVGQILEHVAGEAGECAGTWGHKLPFIVLLVQAGCTLVLEPIPGTPFPNNGWTDEEAANMILFNKYYIKCAIKLIHSVSHSVRNFVFSHI